MNQETRIHRVCIQPCRSYDPQLVAEAVRTAMDALGGIARFVKPGMKVVLKPNLLSPRKPEDATTTHPALVQAVAELARQAGAEVTIADSPGGPMLARALRMVYAATGMEPVAAATNATLNLDVSTSSVSCERSLLLKRLDILRVLAEADLVINLPKLKTHSQMVFTGAVKNLFGAIAGTEKIEYHMRLADADRFAEALIDICLAARAGLTIMDAVVGMDGAGPSAGDPCQIGLFLAGESPFAVDLAALGVVGADPKGVPVMKAAIARGLCPPRVEDLEIVGRSIEQSRVRRFDIPGMDRMVTITWSGGPVMRWLGRRAKPRPIFLHNVCTGCGVCERSCPAKAIRMREHRPYADLEACIRCFCCQELCPSKAVKVKRLRPGLSALLRIVYFLIGMIRLRSSPAPGHKPAGTPQD